MIQFNRTHYNMSEIVSMEGVSDIATPRQILLYGIRSYCGDNIIISRGTKESVRLKRLRLAFNGIGVEIKPTVMDREKSIHVGFPRRLRENPELCSLIMRTIVLFLVGKLTIPDGYKILPDGYTIHRINWTVEKGTPCAE